MARKSYTAEYMASAVALVRDEGVTVAKAARDLGISATALKRWVEDAAAPEASGEKELRRRIAELERENRRLSLERDILKKATACFARDLG